MPVSHAGCLPARDESGVAPFARVGSERESGMNERLSARKKRRALDHLRKKKSCRGCFDLLPIGEDVVHVFPFPDGVFFHLVTTGWIFDISLLCESSINQSINQSSVVHDDRCFQQSVSRNSTIAYRVSAAVKILKASKPLYLYIACKISRVGVGGGGVTIYLVFRSTLQQ